ncbi:nucleotidyltransferase domain-containing protein [Rossellomorea sp. AcN35-11]|nr:nucleotidyltransferase domain-containing protein [Rossellomorea aquimaris]WJV28417.1 nucleotidyltransferase domain-containing protein [Rossellomorea sp. AcN35-11]
MKNRIMEELKRIEEEEKVKVLYAVEAGSRAWGYHTDRSDFDVRFIYIREVKAYLNLQETSDVIETCTHQGLECSGWDLKKALKLLRKSNPSLLEWLTPENIYWEHSSIEKIRKMRDIAFSPDRCIIHYFHMTKRNFEKRSKDGAAIPKEWMTIIRPWLSYQWIIKYRTFPPNEIFRMLEHLPVNGETKDTLIFLITSRVEERKVSDSFMKNLEVSIHHDVVKMEELVEGLIINEADLWDELNQTFFSMLKEVWGGAKPEW